MSSVRSEALSETQKEWVRRLLDGMLYPAQPAPVPDRAPDVRIMGEIIHETSQRAFYRFLHNASRITAKTAVAVVAPIAVFKGFDAWMDWQVTGVSAAVGTVGGLMLYSGARAAQRSALNPYAGRIRGQAGAAMMMGSVLGLSAFALSPLRATEHEIATEIFHAPENQIVRFDKKRDWKTYHAAFQALGAGEGLGARCREYTALQLDREGHPQRDARGQILMTPKRTVCRETRILYEDNFYHSGLNEALGNLKKPAIKTPALD